MHDLIDTLLVEVYHVEYQLVGVLDIDHLLGQVVHVISDAVGAQVLAVPLAVKGNALSGMFFALYIRAPRGFLLSKSSILLVLLYLFKLIRQVICHSVALTAGVALSLYVLWILNVLTIILRHHCKIVVKFVMAASKT